MSKPLSFRAASRGGILAMTLAAAACGRGEAAPVAADEPAVLADYVAITEQIADAVAAHPEDRAAAGEALDALFRAHREPWTKTVARMRALYKADVARALGDRMPNRHPDLLERLEAASKRLAAHVSGAPWVLHDEKARDVLASLAINAEYASLIREKWEQTGPPDGADPEGAE
ncbi:MAG: hypothetical protein CVU56_18990 [Deltaproteobacteria bacterium HGW-Deltaproteobacteria-14]|jgi:hypothetical protein|nr:MAG: hypothetical protein CVU56_18990 [Deltaproteobacteria bacterium HGW-Deltaproteobacteria-14]